MKDFTLREVEAFASVMQHGTVTKAADFLDIAQPGVSKLLAQFEAKAGFLVFHRHKKRLVPTPEAFTLCAEVERTFNSVRQITKVARDISDLRIGRLKIGLLPAMGSGVMPAIIYSFLGRHPEVRATINVRSTQTLVEWAGRNPDRLGYRGELPDREPCGRAPPTASGSDRLRDGSKPSVRIP